MTTTPLERIADALERIADAMERREPPKVAYKPNVIPVCSVCGGRHYELTCPVMV